MSSILIFLVPVLVLGPLWFCLVVFRVWFPKHTLKVNQTLLLPIGLLLFIAANCIQIYFLFNWLPQLCCGETNYFEEIMLKLSEGSLCAHLLRVLFLLSFYFVPATLTALIAVTLRKCWESTLKPTKGTIDTLASFVGRKTGELLFNFMGQLTAYNPETEELMVDVFTNDSYLYCGIYSDYYIDQEGKFLGVSISNALRHRIAHDPATGKRVGNDAYIVPNQGEIFFPQEKINNFHVWRMRADHLFSTKMADEHHPVLLAWYLAIQYVSRIKIRVKLLGENFDQTLIKRFFDCLERLRIKIEDVKLEFEEDDKTSTPAENPPPKK